MKKFFRLKLRFAHTRRGLQMRRWCDVIAGSSAPISPIRNLICQNQHEIARTGKQIVMVGRPEVLSQCLPSFRYRLSVVYQRSLNVSEQNCNVCCSKVWIQLTPKRMCAIYSTALPLTSLEPHMRGHCSDSTNYLALILVRCLRSEHQLFHDGTVD